MIMTNYFQSTGDILKNDQDRCTNRANRREATHHRPRRISFLAPCWHGRNWFIWAYTYIFYIGIQKWKIEPRANSDARSAYITCSKTYFDDDDTLDPIAPSLPLIPPLVNAVSMSVNAAMAMTPSMALITNEVKI